MRRTEWTSGGLILIKHAMAEIVETVSSHEWRLSDSGRQSCRRLAAALALYEPDVVVTSAEPKAAETGEVLAAALGIPCRSSAGLHENDRTGFPYLSDDDYVTTFQRFFKHPADLIVGCETANQARERFAAAVAGTLSTHPDQTVVIVAHGTVISLFVEQVAGLDPFALWRQLGLPSFVVLNRATMSVERTVPQLR